MRNGRPASRPITNPLATIPLPLVTRRRCSSPGPSQGAHITSRSTLDLRTLDSAICAHSVGGVGENHRTECGLCRLRKRAELAIWVAEVEGAGEKLEATLEPCGKT